MELSEVNVKSTTGPEWLSVTGGEIVSSILRRDPTAMLEYLAKVGLQAVDAEVCSIFLVSDTLPGHLVLEAGYAKYPKADFVPRPICIDNTESALLGRAVKKRQPIRLAAESLAETVQHSADVSPLLKSGKCVSLLVVPLIDRVGEVTGVIELINKSSDRADADEIEPFSDDDEKSIRGLAGEIERLRDVFRVARAYQHRLTPLRDAQHTEDVYQYILNTATRLLHADRGDLAVWNAERERLVVRSLVGSGSWDMGQPIPPKGIIRAVWETGVPQLVNDVEKHGDYVPIDRSVKSEAAIRWELNGGHIGVLNVESFEANHFGDFDLALLTPLLDTAAVEHQMLVETIRFREVAHAIIEDLPPRAETLETILDGMREIYGFNAGLIYLANHESRQLDCSACIGVDGRDFSLSFDEPSLATKVFGEREGHWIEDPTNSDVPSRRGIERFNIRSSVIGVPLLFRDEPVGVLVVWHKEASDFAKAEHIEALKPFARLAAAHIGMCEMARRRERAQRAFRALQERMQTEISVDRNVDMLMRAVREVGFERVRVFDYREATRTFEFRRSLGTHDDLTGFSIALDESRYARHIAETACSEPGARIYDPRDDRWFGTDPDAAGLGRPVDLPWAAVPLVVGGRLCGQITADNALSGREIHEDSLEYLTMLGALAAQAIATERTFQVMNTRALSLLHDHLGVEDPKATTVRRLLVFLTSAESLGFSRALFFERNEVSGQFEYSAGLGSVDSERHAYVGEAGHKKGLVRLFEEAADFDDEQLNEAVRGLAVDVDDPVVTELMKEDHGSVRELTRVQMESSPCWMRELARRIDADHLLVSLVRDGTDLLGLLIVDRRWQERAISEADKRALGLGTREMSGIIRQHRLNQQVLQSRDLAAIGFVAKGLAHELGQPIGNLRLDTDNFIRDWEAGDSQAATEDVARIDASVSRLVQTVGALRSLLHPELSMVRRNVQEILNDVAGLCRRRAEDHGVRFTVHVGASVGVVAVIPTLLRQALINLIANAQSAVERAAVAKAEIEVTADLDDDGWLAIRVIDNGCGIPPEYLEIVRRRGSIFTTDPSKGLGIGLEIVRQTADAHRGQLIIESEVDRGTTMTLRIPVAQEGARSWE